MHKGSAHMHRSFANSLGLAIAAAVIVAGAAWANRGGALKATYLYDLANDSGNNELSWSPLSWDNEHSELYVVTGSTVQVYNQVGMAIFAFGDDGKYGRTREAAPFPTGDVFVLAHGTEDWALVRYSYRGEPLEKVEISELPEAFEDDFRPDALRHANGELFLADTGAMRVLVLNPSGEVLRSHDIGESFKKEGDDVPGMRGFGVDPRGNVLFTVPAQFLAFVVSADGELRGFGTRGSTPGKFNVISGITSDEEGRIYVVDALRAVVSVWEPDLSFVGEFGGRGFSASSLRSPFHVVAANNRVYVAQSRGGVKVFGLRFE
jgi:hypothetical protein